MMNSTNTPKTPAAVRWNGWARHGIKTCWRLLVEGVATEDEARELLHQRVAGFRCVDTYFAPAGIDPN